MAKPAKNSKKFCQKKIHNGTKQILSVAIAAATGSGQQSIRELSVEEKKQETTGDEKNDTGVRIEDPITISPVKVTNGSNTNKDEHVAEDATVTVDNGAEPKLLVEVMGGLDSRSNAVIIDGDEFFEADENLIETEEESLATTEMFADAFDEARR